MTFDLVIISVSERAVQCAMEDGSPAFWLPRKQVEWRGFLEAGEMVTAEVPRWLAQKHSQLVASRVNTQKVLDLHPVELDPIKSQEPIPMADDRQNTGRGALFRATEKKSDRAPDYRGDLTLADGTKLELAGWLKEDRNGKKYLSLSAKPFEDQRRQDQPANAYAQTTGRADDRRQQTKPDLGGPSFDGETIPFAPDR
jgi:hypothetical protein